MDLGILKLFDGAVTTEPLRNLAEMKQVYWDIESGTSLDYW